MAGRGACKHFLNQQTPAALFRAPLRPQLQGREPQEHSVHLREHVSGACDKDRNALPKSTELEP